MIGLDTNILVRLLTRDDEAQAQLARALFDAHADEDGALFVSDVVLAELVWTLERTYGLERTAIAETIGALLDNATLAFESRSILKQAHVLFLTEKAGFADCLIVAKAQATGCELFVTFDSAMRGLPGVQCN
jgi:predicted nucleic-acid-binding protein